MKRIIEYLYYHFFSLITIFRKLNARDTTVLYITLIEFFLSFSPITYAIFLIFGGKNFIPYFIFGLPFLFLIKYINDKLFFKKKDFHLNVIERYKNESKVGRIVGYILCVGLLITSPIIGFAILSLW